MIKTKDITIIRGQTLVIEFTVRDYRGAVISLSGAKVFMWIRADMKVDAQVKLASEATTGHRVGITINVDQVGAGKGKFTVSLVPADTTALVALGIDDPYFYDVWVVDAALQKFPVLATSRLGLYPQVTTVP